MSELTPADIARLDQQEAFLSDLARLGAQAIVLRVDDPPPGSTCCWCTCPDGTPIQECTGCGVPAELLLSIYGVGEDHLPLCLDHFPLATSQVAILMAAGGPETRREAS